MLGFIKKYRIAKHEEAIENYYFYNYGGTLHKTIGDGYMLDMDDVCNITHLFEQIICDIEEDGINKYAINVVY